VLRWVGVDPFSGTPPRRSLRVQRVLQNHHRGRLVDDLPVAASGSAGRMQRLMRGHRAHPFIDQPHPHGCDGLRQLDSVRARGTGCGTLGTE